ncbi:hypothetical protein D3C72_1364770 [compost metagenome]
MTSSLEHAFRAQLDLVLNARSCLRNQQHNRTVGFLELTSGPAELFVNLLRVFFHVLCSLADVLLHTLHRALHVAKHVAGGIGDFHRRVFEGFGQLLRSVFNRMRKLSESTLSSAY